MGCDIHAYVEYKKKDRKDNYWSDFGGRINPGRNYYLFGLMAGVRSNAELFQAKGLPERNDLGCASRGDYYLFISETESEEYVNLETAKRYESYGHKIINGNNGEPTWVEHPDWHTPSWLALDEYKKVIEKYKSEPDVIKFKYQEPEYEALLSAMEKLAEFDNDVRVVFWFDN